MRKPAAFVTGVLLAMVAGCSSPSGSVDAASAGTMADGGFLTAVSGTKTLNSLSPSERAQLCADASAFADGTLAPDECRGYSLDSTSYAATQDGTLSDSSLQMACSSTYDTCLASTNGGGTTTPPTLDGATTVPLPGDAGSPCDALFAADCSATVAELSSCYSDLAQAYTAVPSCSTVTRSGLAALTGDGGPLSAMPFTYGPCPWAPCGCRHSS